MTRPSDHLNTIATAAQMLGTVLAVAVLYVARDVFIPLTLAILLSFLLSPIANRLQRVGIGNTLSVIVTAFIAFVLLVGTLALVGRELTHLVTELPQYKEELIAKARGVAGISSGMGGQLEELREEVSDALDDSEEQAEAEQVLEEGSPSEVDVTGAPLPSNVLQGWATRLFPAAKPNGSVHDGQSTKTPLYVRPVAAASTPLMSWAGTLGSLLGPLGTIGLVCVFVLFLLVYREDMQDRIIKVISRGDYVTTTEALQEVSRRISRYLLAQSFVNVSYGVVLSLGLFVIGLFLAPDGNFPNVVLWGVLATLLRFVPYMGPIVAGAFPIMVSIAVFPGYSVPVAVVSLIVVIELLSNNLIEPWLYGASTGLSAIAVILAAVFWGWMWGPVGLLLSTPLTVCLVVLGRHVPRFRIFATLLGEEVNIRASLRFYQRLLSANDAKISSFLSEYIQNNGAESTLDKVLVPALKRVRIDQDREHLTTVEAVELTNNVEQAVAAVEWSSEKVEEENVEDTSSSKEPHANSKCDRPAQLKIVGCAAHHFSEEILMRAFSRANPAYDMTVLDNAKLPDSMADDIVDLQPDVVLIHVLPPGGFVQARYLCRTIRESGYRATIVVCCCGKFRYFDKLFVKFRKSGANYVTTNWTQTALKLASLCPKQPKLESRSRGATEEGGVPVSEFEATAEI